MGYNCLLDDNFTSSNTREVYLSKSSKIPKGMIKYPNLRKLAASSAELGKQFASFLSRLEESDTHYFLLNDDKSYYKADLMLFLSSSSLILPNLLDSTLPEGDSKTV